MREQIQWDRTDFPDNQPCVDLIEKKPMGTDDHLPHCLLLLSASF